MARGRLAKASVGHGLLVRNSSSINKGSYWNLLLLVVLGSVLAIGAWKLGLSILPVSEEGVPRSTLEVSNGDGDTLDEVQGKRPCKCPTAADLPEEDFSTVLPDLPASSEANATLACDTLAACQTPYRKCGERDACGKRVNCGGCNFPDTCGGGDEHDKCGCKPQTCQSLQRNCGHAPDGCGGIMLCGKPCEPWILDLASNAKPPEPKRPYRIGRFSNLAQYREGDLKVVVGDIDTKHYSHIIFNYATIEKGSLAVKATQWNDPDVTKEYFAKGNWHLLSDACHLTGTVPMLSIGGWEFTNGEEGKAIFSELLSSASEREKFVTSLGEWMELYNYQGLEFDWQWPERQQLDNFLTLLRDIRARFDKLKEKTGWRYWLSIRGPAGPGFADSIFPDKRAFADAVDWMAILTAGLRRFEKGSGTVHTTAAAPIYSSEPLSVSSSIGHWKAASVPSEKIILEVGTSGVLWQLQSSSVNTFGAPAKGPGGKDGVGTISYRALLKEFSGEKAARDVFHGPTSTVYAYKDDQWVSYEDARTIVMKVDFVVQQQLGGYMLEIEEDDAKFSLSTAASERTKPTHIELRKDFGPIMLVSSSPSTPCETSQGTFMLTRAMKNKVDFAQRNNWTLTWSQAVLEPQKGRPFTRPALFKKLLAAHPEVDWFMWTDSDAVFTDMFFQIPFKNYRWHNLVINGSKNCVYEKNADGKVDWNCINAGIFLLRNSPWSQKLVNDWFELTCEEKTKESELIFAEALTAKPEGVRSNDQSALLYLLHKDQVGRGEKTYFEDSGMFHGPWESLVDKYEAYEDKAGPGHVWSEGNRPPFFTHFAGCKMCAPKGASSVQDKCFEQMDRALNFADNQILDMYQMKHVDLASPALISTLASNTPITAT